MCLLVVKAAHLALPGLTTYLKGEVQEKEDQRPHYRRTPFPKNTHVHMWLQWYSHCRVQQISTMQYSVTYCARKMALRADEVHVHTPNSVIHISIGNYGPVL